MTGLTSGLSGTSSDNHYATVKYNSSGIQQWVARYDGPGYDDGDIAYAIALDVSGNVYVTGSSSGSGTYHDYGTVKYNSSGTQQWVAWYNGPGSLDIAYAIAVDASGDVYVTGQSEGLGTSHDYATVKYNASGAEQWVHRYNGPGNYFDQATDIAADASGNVYVTGVSYGSGTYADYATVKYSSSGAEQWIARHNGPANSEEAASAIAVDVSGNVYVTGSTAFAAGTQYTTIKYQQLATGVLPNVEIPQSVALHQNYPNPFNPATTIRYDLPKGTDVRLTVVNTLGQEVARLVDGFQDAGVHQATWSAGVNASGVYFYRLQAGGFTETRKLVLLR